MKIKVSDEFQPIDFRITIESIDELLTLWAIFANQTKKDIIAEFEIHPTMKPKESMTEIPFNIFDELNSVCKKYGFTY